MFGVESRIVMKNPLENDDKGPYASPASGTSVPGLSETLADLRTTYPDLTEGSLGRILGLPIKEDLVRKTVVSDRGEKETEE